MAPEGITAGVTMYEWCLMSNKLILQSMTPYVKGIVWCFEHLNKASPQMQLFRSVVPYLLSSPLISTLLDLASFKSFLN